MNEETKPEISLRIKDIVNYRVVSVDIPTPACPKKREALKDFAHAHGLKYTTGRNDLDPRLRAE